MLITTLELDVGLAIVAAGGFSLGVWLRPQETAFKVRSAKAGRAGESRVAATLRLAGHSAIHDLTIRVAGKSHQLDHIVTGTNRLFVLETKNWRGRVKGYPSSRHWTLHRPNHSLIWTYSPLAQNAVHAAALSKLVRVPVTPLIVSAGYVELSAELESLITPLKDLPQRLDPPGTASHAIHAAFERLSALKAHPRQRSVAARHHDRTIARFNPRPTDTLFLASAVAVAALILLNHALF